MKARFNSAGAVELEAEDMTEAFALECWQSRRGKATLLINREALAMPEMTNEWFAENSIEFMKFLRAKREAMEQGKSFERPKEEAKNA